MNQLNIGCGRDVLEGFDNCDNSPKIEGVIKADILTLDNIQSNFYDLVYSRMVVEHIHVDMLPTAFHQVFRVLKNGGTFRFVTVDFDGVIKFYKSIKGFLSSTSCFNAYREMCYHLMGAELQEGVVGHQAVLTFEFLKILLRNEGFVKIRKIKGEDSMSITIEAQKKDGRPFATRKE